jgi:hypothetical protein
MMRALTEDAVLLCDHGGKVDPDVHQSWVTIEGRRVLVAKDPEDRSISGCPNTNPFLGLKPCKKTLRVTEGYSTFIRIDGRPVCLDTVTGLTDGTPQGSVKYTVKNPGQTLVESDA